MNKSSEFTKDYIKESFFSKNVTFLIKSRRISQKVLADTLNIGSTAISKWKSGEGFPNVNTLLNFASFYKVKLDTLFFTDLEQLKKKSADSNAPYNDRTKLEMEDQIRSMLERLDRLEAKIG